MRNRDADHAERLVSVGVNSPRNIGPFNAETNYGWIDITQSVCVTRLNFWEDEACQFGGIKTDNSMPCCVWHYIQLDTSFDVYHYSEHLVYYLTA